MKWKYQKDKPRRLNDLFLRLPEGKWKTVLITGWSFEKAANGSIFKCEVIEEDGQPVDKFWSVWDYELKEMLKAALKGKKPEKHRMTVSVKKKVSEGDESFEMK